MKHIRHVLSWVGIGLAAVLHGFSAETNNPALQPPVPTVITRSPVESFRALLVMPAADRRAQLATRPPDVRERLLERIQEYQTLTPEERDLRLQVTELQWYFKLFARLPATNRTVHLQSLPEDLRNMVTVRLQQWDAMPANLQQMLLTNPVGAEYLAPNSRPDFPPNPVRSQLIARYNRLFELSDREKERIWTTLSTAEQRQMEKTLQAYEALTPAQRAHCLRSMAVLTSLSPAERQIFLKNAERWAQMKPSERQAWREVVSKAATLPALPLPPRPVPPLPTNARQTAPGFATNGG
ncbi:MAG: DUF3106 domain-containing protein [Verrucomicrobiae bacterium]|nr:DUF3106 domain-containing protein [Verrucomicrobiae bacterium]